MAIAPPLFSRTELTVREGRDVEKGDVGHRRCFHVVPKEAAERDIERTLLGE